MLWPIGSYFETAMWLTGYETPEMLERFKRDCQAAMDFRAEQDDIIMSPLVFTEKAPGSPRVPQVPAHISGPNVRLLVAEATVIAHRNVAIPRSFVADLDRVDLMRLRERTRRAHRSGNPQAKRLTDDECDAIIEEIGPDSAANVVRDAVNDRTLH